MLRTFAGLIAASLPIVAVTGQTTNSAISQPQPLNAEQVAKARALFVTWNCGSCHILTDAEAYGDDGPTFDGSKDLDHDFAVKRIADGLNAMPAFREQLSARDIDLLARYIIQVRK